MIIIQFIEIAWTKKSRGQPMAALRNAVPLGFRVPSLQNGECPPVFIHWVKVEEATRFQPIFNEATCGSLQEVQFAGILLALASVDEELEVIFLCEGARIGAPRRRYLRKKAFQLAPDTWGRITVNGRHSSASLYGYSGGGWTYHRFVINVANQSGMPDILFPNEPSTHNFQDVAILW